LRRVASVAGRTLVLGGEGDLDGALFGYARRGGSFLLTPPTLPVFLVSLALAAAALLVHYAGVPLPMLGKARAFDVLALGYGVLLISVLLRRL